MTTVTFAGPELSIFRPAWTQRKRMAADDLYFCGVKYGYFKRSQGMAGKILKKLGAGRYDESD